MADENVAIALEPCEMVPIGLFPITSVIICGIVTTSVMVGQLWMPKRERSCITIHALEKEQGDG